jgi:MFS transporter, SHS family, lactate transporter
MFATWLEQEFKVDPTVVATPVLLSNLAALLACGPWGGLSDRIGRRKASMLQAISGALLAPIYLLTRDINWIVAGFILQGALGGMLPLMSPSYLSERFPTEVRATAMGFCYQGGIVCGGFVPVLVSYLAVEHHMGFAVPMLIATWIGAASVVGALLISPETKGKSLRSEPGTHGSLPIQIVSEPQTI